MGAGTKIVIPAAHVFSRSGESGALTEDFQKAVVRQVEEEVVILIELPLERRVLKLDLVVGEGFEGSGDGRWDCRGDAGSG